MNTKEAKRTVYFLLLCGLIYSSPLISQVSPKCNLVNPTCEFVEKADKKEIVKWLKKMERPGVESVKNLSINGQVTAKWKNIHEKLGGIKQVGMNSVTGIPNNQFEIDVKLQFNYREGKTWVGIECDFDNKLGSHSGTIDRISLNRAYLGYHFLKFGPVSFDLTVGRRKMSEMYNSDIEFDSRAEGATLILVAELEKMVAINLKYGLYLVDARVAQPMWVAQVALYNIANIGTYIDYTLTDWTHTGIDRNGIRDNPQYRFIISQWLVGWNFLPKYIKKDIKLFAAFLLNHDAQRTAVTKNKKENIGWYAGFQFGAVRKRRDFALKAEWQMVQAQAIPDFDISGIERGNAQGGTFFLTPGKPQFNGNGNYQGAEVSLLLAISDYITIKPRVQRAVSADKNIGDSVSYTAFKIDTSYTF